MINKQATPSDFLKDISLRTHYLFQWRQQQRITPATPSRKGSLQDLRRSHDHIQHNKRVLKRGASKHYGLKDWQGKQSIINKVEYPLNSGDPEAIEEAYIMSKLLFQQEAPLPYAVITPKANNNKSTRSSSLVSSQIAKTKREIEIHREAEMQKVVSGRTKFKPNGKLLPSISIKRTHPQKPIIKVPQKQEASPKPARRLSLPNFQSQQSIIKLIQF